MASESEARLSEEGREILRLTKEAYEAMAARDRLSGIRPTAKKAETAGVGKKKKVVRKRVSKELIEGLKERPYRFNEIPQDDLMAKCSQEFRDIYAANKLIADKMIAYQRALIAQYDALGFAEEVTEVTDDEEDVAGGNDKVEAAN